jgi:hypothetical protein
MEKSADYLVEFFKEQCKALFFFVSNTLTLAPPHIMLAMLEELTVKKSFTDQWSLRSYRFS